MKKVILLCMLLALLAGIALPVSANTCGDEITWEYADGVLTITGTGKMDDFESTAPWHEYKDQIQKVVISDGITYIGARSFNDYDALKEVEFGNSVYEIGPRAFRSCDGLTSIDLPASFKVFGEESFRSCKNLKEIHCSGRFPSFRQNSMWDTYVTIYYPAERPWGVQYIQQLEEAFKGRIEFLASDGTDHYNPEETTATQPPETTVPPTEPATQPPETTEPPTEPTMQPTEPTTQPTEPQTQPTESVSATTEPQTQPPQATVKPTQPPQNPPSEGGSGRDILPWLLLGSLVFALIALLFIVKNTSRGGKYTQKRRRR